MLRSVESGNRQNQQKSGTPLAASSLPGRHAALPESKFVRLQAMHGNQGVQRLLRDGRLQRKLTINQLGDAFEQEADRVAEKVMRMPDPAATPVATSGMGARLQRCSCGTTSPGGGQCEECKSKAMQLQRSAAGPTGNATAPPIVHDVLNSPGRPLDAATRNFMEPRFGTNFSNVRVHTDGKAAESAKAVDALAYTVGKDIVFAAGQYSTESSAGNKLLAHELAHTVQQGSVSTQASTATNSPASVGATIARAVNQHSLQRRCETFTYPGRTPGVTSVPGKPCVDQQGTTGVTGSPVLEHFGESSSSLIPLHAGQVTALQSALLPTDTVEIHGYASCDGTPQFNIGLSCDRAEAVKRALTTAGSAPFTGTVTTFAHGETNEFGGLLENRRVIIKVTHAIAPPPPPPALPHCGPDVTDWFLDEINHAATDPAVLSVQSDLTAAARIAARRGTRVDTFAEAGATAAVQAQETNLATLGIPSPTRSGAIVGQMAAGSTAQSAAASALPSALRADPFHPGAVAADFAALATLMASAAFKWRALVNHGARFDFKAHILHFPGVGPGCPDNTCPPGEVGIVTLCPGGSSPQNCYESDLPGNIFYALIGRHVGFSELTLQLGSQLAELTDLPRPGRPAVTWDSPEDTAAIHLGFSLGASLPLSRASLCGSVTPSRGILDARTGCDDCTSAFPIHFV
jgi:outer membrane protein OmpA-like peptidoglycan-associated protein